MERISFPVDVFLEKKDNGNFFTALLNKKHEGRRRLWQTVVFILLMMGSYNTSAQSIIIDNANFQTGIFGQGSTIAVPIQITGCFRWNNSIRLYLCNPTNLNGTLVGTFNRNGFFSTFVNATIPNGTPARIDYFFEARTNLPVDTSNRSTAFEIKNATAPSAFVNTTLPRRLIDSLYYGYCSGNPPTVRSITLINQSTTGSVTTINYKDESTGIITNLPLATGASTDVSLNVTYYTLFCKAEKDGITSTRCFFLVNPTHNISLQTSGEQRACLPDILQFSVNTSSLTNGIGTNFPGTYYVFDWGDTSPNDTLTNCQILASNGVISHVYTDVSCNKTAVVGGTTYSNAYPVDIKYINPFKNAGNTNNCDEPPVATFARIFRKPQADFNIPAPICLGNSVRFRNTTVNGVAQQGNLCTSAQENAWFVDGVFITDAIDLNYTFNAPGTHIIRLLVENSSCSPSEITKIICVEPVPVPDFKMDGRDSLAACAPLSFGITNTTTASLCGGYKWKWQVYNDSTGVLVNPSASVYTITPNDSAFQPSFTFNVPGRYRIRLSVTSSCNTFTVNKIVKVLGTAGVFLRGDMSFCTDNVTIDFGANANRPNYNSNIGNETYLWTITGGAYSFQNGTSATSQYPVILFNDYGIYTLSVQFTNNCGVQTSLPQHITLSQPNTVDAGPDSLKICYDQPAITLTGNATGPTDSLKWFTNGTGAFSSVNNASSVYNVTNVDKIRGFVWLTLRAYAKQPSGCPDVKDTIKVRIYPLNSGNDTSKTICSQNNVAYPPRSSVAGSTFTWTSSVTSGTVTGNTPAGSGIINDILINTDNTTDGVVKYVITPVANGCTGTSYTLTVTIKPKPVLTASTGTTICSGDTTNILLSSSVANSRFSWISSVISGSIAGNTSRTNQALVLIRDKLTNTGTTDAMVMYKIVSIGPTGCAGDTQTVQIMVSAGATPANAGTDQKLCAALQTVLNGNAPTVGTGEWIQVSGPPSTIVSPATNTTPITGLVLDSVYRYVWQITAANSTCGISRDTVAIFVRRQTIQADAGDSVSVCISAGNTYTLRGNQPRSYETGTWSIVSSSFSLAPAFTDRNNPGSNINGLRPGTVVLRWMIASDAPGCSPTSDTMRILISDLTPAANAGRDTTLCNQSTYTLFGNNPLNVTGTWSVLPGSTATITDPSRYNSTITQLSAGVNHIVWTLTNGVCQPSHDTVSITVLPELVNVIENDTRTICLGQPVTINGNTPTGGNGSYQYQWQSSANNIFFTNIPGATFSNLTISPTITTYYRRIVNSLPCSKASDTITVIVQPGISANNINSSPSVCINTPAAPITGSVPSGGNNAYAYQWQSSFDGITWTNIDTATSQNFSPGVLTQTTRYRRLVNTNLCNGPQASTSNIIQITVNPDARAAFDPTRTIGCAPFTITPAIINLIPDASVGEYRWYVNNSYIGSGQSFPQRRIDNPGDSITVKLIAISRFGCKNDSAQHGFKTFARPVPSFTQSDTSGCGPVIVTFNNTTAQASDYNFTWNFGQGQTSALQQPGAVSFPVSPNSADTVYTVIMKVVNQCEAVADTGFVKVRSKPKALFTPDKTEGCSPMRVTFTNTSRGTNANYVWDFGDGTPLFSTNDATVQHTYSVGVRTTFYVKLRGANECGSDSLTYAIVVNPNSIRLDFAINGNERFGCAPHTVQFINNTTGANIFNWDFGDGTTINTTRGIDTVVHTYTTAGNFTTKLFAANSCNDTTDTEMVTVQQRPRVSFTAPVVTCLADTIHFINTSDNGISNRWSFGDGSASVDRNPDKQYAVPGTYRVMLTGSNIFSQGFSCSDTAYANIRVVDTLSGDFTASDTVSACLPFTVTFKNTNRPSVQTTWTFGDGGFATGDSVIHTFTGRGNFVVQMTSRGNGRCFYTAGKTIRINSPTGTLSYNGGYVCSGAPVRFMVQGGNASQYRFVFGDGDSVTTSNSLVVHQYTKPGIYVPYAYLVEGSCRIKLITGDTIRADKITAGFKSNLQYSCGSTAVQFIDTSTAFFGIIERQWSFGDGTTSSLPDPKKVYTQTGDYRVQLQVTGQSGCVETITVPLSIAVRSFPRSSIRGDTVVCTGQTADFSALVQSQDSVVSFNWNFGDGTTGRSRKVAVVYNTSGIYTIRLISTTIYGCADTVYRTIQVNAGPLVNAGANVSICRGQSVQLQALGAGSWQWTPLQDLSCYNCANPVANPSFSTQYVVKGTNNLNCSATDTITVEVIQPVKLTVTPDDSICIGEQTQLFASGAVKYLWNPVAGLTSGNVPNPVANPTVTTQYQVIGRDAYNCFADTGYITVAVGNYPVVDLGSGGTVVAGTPVTFSPQLGNGPFKSYTWTPFTSLSCNNCPQPVATINNDITYKLEVENVYGCKASDTIIYKVICEEATQVFIPNAFSPDNDGLNDVLMVRGKGLSRVKYFRIFNRWGQLVFERNNFNANDPQQGWDGKINGVPANPGVFVYTAEVVCTAGASFIKKGNVTLVR